MTTIEALNKWFEMRFEKLASELRTWVFQIVVGTAIVQLVVAKLWH
jgi:hypothetical protein